MLYIETKNFNRFHEIFVFEIKWRNVEFYVKYLRLCNFDVKIQILIFSTTENIVPLFSFIYREKEKSIP